MAKIAYHDFLTLWKDADADIPIFSQAKAEFESWMNCTESMASGRRTPTISAENV